MDKMLFSGKSKEIIDSCRFCWMCRHICPVGNVTGRERNNARARALSLSMVTRGMDLTPDIVDNIYECALCGACTKECVTGWDPVAFTKEARLEAAVNGLMPDYISRMLDNMERTGNPYGKAGICAELAAEIEGLPQEAGVLLFLGTDARYMGGKSAADAVRLMKRAGAGFAVLADEPESGYVPDTLTGRSEEARQAMQRAAGRLDYKTIVAYDPADAKVFLREYREWGIEMDVRVITFTSFVNELVKSGSLSPVKSNTVFTYQDPFHLARDLEETSPAREILSACGGVKEMLLSGRDTMWPGSLLMSEYLPDVVERAAMARWENAASTHADVLVTASPSEYEVLARVKPENMGLMSIEEVLLKACGEGA